MQSERTTNRHIIKQTITKKEAKAFLFLFLISILYSGCKTCECPAYSSTSKTQQQKIFIGKERFGNHESKHNYIHLTYLKSGDQIHHFSYQNRPFTYSFAIFCLKN